MKQSILALENVSLKPILHNINYEVNAGDFVILLGSNGSGKSSLLKTIDRRYSINSGKIMLANKTIPKYSSKEFSRLVITLTQNCQDSLFCSLTVLENCMLANERHKNNSSKLTVNKSRAFFIDYLVQFNSKLATKLDTIVSVLSGGEQQTLTLALSMLHPPKILLLDEHTSALDPKTSENVLDITNRVVRKHKITCILSTHDLKIAVNFGNRILALSNGKILSSFDYEGKSALTTNDLLKICYR